MHHGFFQPCLHDNTKRRLMDDQNHEYKSSNAAALSFFKTAAERLVERMGVSRQCTYFAVRASIRYGCLSRTLA